MAIKSATINLLLFPQFWEPPRLTVNVLMIPKGDPMALAPAFPSCTPIFDAAIIPTLETLPTAAGVSDRITLPIDIPLSRPALFTALQAAIPVRVHAGGPVAPHPALAVKKAATQSYLAATVGSRPRSSALVSGDEYNCVLRDNGAAKPAPAGDPPRDFYWEEIYAFCLRQPVLARELGLIYETFVDLPDANMLAQGGFIYPDLSPASDYSGLPRAMFAARLPELRAARRVFAAVLFPVDQPGIFDHVSAEAAAYDDGFAKVVHGAQPRIAAVVESSRSTLPPVKDVGIRLGWDDEQVAVWLSRQLGIDAFNPGAAAPGAPLGVSSYRVDVFDDLANAWQSLNAGQADLLLSGIDLGRFDDELGVEALPVNLNNDPKGEFWLPSFFTTWAGGSLVVTDPTPYRIAGNLDPLNDQVYTAVGADSVTLRYGRDYRFRVRLADLTGGGPKSDEDPRNPARAQVAIVPFRRFSPPKDVRAIRTDGGEPDARDQHFQVFRPQLGYPDILFTDFPDTVNLLLAQTADAQNERREPALPDPDATQLRIDVEVRSLTRDPLATNGTAQAFVPVFSILRDFPEDPEEPLELDFQFIDVPTLNAAFGGDPILLPSARSVRLVLTPIGADRPDYWGTPQAREGAAPISVYVSAPSEDERNLLLPPSFGPQIEAIFLQPDEERRNVDTAALAASGLRHEAASDVASRLAVQLDVPHTGLTYSAPAGTRMVFAASSSLRHTLNPDGSSITFSSKNDLVRHWIVALRFTIDRDWSWNALNDVSFEIRRDGALVGQIALPRVLGDTAIQPGADRDHTSIVFLDAFDPKPGPPPDFPKEINTEYALTPVFRTPPLQADDPFEWAMRLPVTTPPRQTPKLLSAGWAFGPYSPDDRYASTEERTRRLYLQLDGAPEDRQDLYFARVLAYSPDPMLIEAHTRLPEPPEPPLPIEAEEVRVIQQGQANDLAGWNAMIPLIASRDSEGFYILELPNDLVPDSPELFGFFVYELRVGHDKSRWCTAHGRFGRPLRVAGAQHPAPPLRCRVNRTRDQVTVAAPYATAVLDGRVIRSQFPRTQMYSLLYAQVMQADGQSWRNVLLGRAQGAPVPPENDIEDRRFLSSLSRFDQPKILAELRILGLPLDSPLSVVAVETMPENPNLAENLLAPIPPFADPLGKDLGQVRILRTSALTPVPPICPPKE